MTKEFTYYECNIKGCGHKSKSEEQAKAHYQTHLVTPYQRKGVERAATRGVVKPAPRYNSKIANAIDSGAGKIRRGLDSVAEISDAINTNYDFNAVFEDFAGTGGLDETGTDAFSGGLLGSQEEKPKRKRYQR